jgi:lactoylglutathione lyase
MLLKSFLHVKIDIQDEERARDFYCNKLRLKQIVRYPLPEGGAIIQLSPNGSPPGIELWCEKPFQSFKNDRLHIAFEVEDVAEVVRRLREEGVTIEEEPFRKGHEIIAFLRDPDGYLIELNEDTTGKSQAEARG